MSYTDASIQRWAEFRREHAALKAKLHDSEAEVTRLIDLCRQARVPTDRIEGIAWGAKEHRP